MASNLVAARSSCRAAFQKCLRSSFTQRKGYATQSSGNTKLTTLKNGVVVATEANPAAPTATVGAWFDAGSRAERATAPGVAHLLERLAVKGAKGRSAALEADVESIGGQLFSYTAREHNAYYANVLKNDVTKAVSVISEIIQNPNISKEAINREREGIIAERERAHENPEVRVFDHLYATAFQGNTFGRPVIAGEDNIRKLNAADVTYYHEDNYTADRLVITGAGAVQHEELVAQVEKAFGSLKAGNTAKIIRTEPPRFVGSDVRIRDDTMPQMHVALAVQSPGLNSPDYPTSLVMQAIVGSWDASLGAAGNLTSKVSHQAHPFHLCNSFASFNEAVSDTGLWGTYIVSENLSGIDDLIWFLQKEWARLTILPTEGDVVIAKNKVKAAIHHAVVGNAAIAEDLGKQLTSTGKHLSPAELAQLVDKVTIKDVARVAGDYLWDQEVAVSAYGPVEGVTDFVRIRGHMARNIW